jgi:hypothetical protein
MKNSRIVVVAIVMLIGSLGIARADSQAARDCIAALNDGRQCCLKSAHTVDLECLMTANGLPTGPDKTAAIKACSVAFSNTSSICTSHYVSDVAVCRADNP